MSTVGKHHEYSREISPLYSKAPSVLMITLHYAQHPLLTHDVTAVHAHGILPVYSTVLFRHYVG